MLYMIFYTEYIYKPNCIPDYHWYIFRPDSQMLTYIVDPDILNVLKCVHLNILNKRQLHDDLEECRRNAFTLYMLHYKTYTLFFSEVDQFIVYCFTSHARIFFLYRDILNANKPMKNLRNHKNGSALS